MPENFKPNHRYFEVVSATWETDDAGNVLCLRHGPVHREAVPRGEHPARERDPQLTFDEFLEQEVLWELRLDDAEMEVDNAEDEERLG